MTGIKAAQVNECECAALYCCDCAAHAYIISHLSEYCKLISVSLRYQIMSQERNESIMEIEKLKRKTIHRLKQIKEEQGLTIAKIIDLMEDRGQFVSETTIKRVFAEGSEEQNFRYQDSIAPIADVLLDIYGEDSDGEDSEALRRIIREKNKLIEFLMMKLDEKEQEFEKRIELYEERKALYEKTIERFEIQIARKDELIERLLDKYLPNKKDDD